MTELSASQRSARTLLWNPTRARNFVKEFLPVKRNTFAANMTLLGSMLGLETAAHINPIFFCYLLNCTRPHETAKRLLGRITYSAFLRHSVAFAKLDLEQLLKEQEAAVGREAKIAAAIRVFEKSEELLVYQYSDRLAGSTIDTLARLSVEEPAAFLKVNDRFRRLGLFTLY